MIRPFQILLLAGLTASIVGLAMLIRLNIIGGGRAVDAKRSAETKYDARFLKALETIKKAYAGNVKYRNSATIREMLRYLSSKFPDHQTSLGSIQTSIEGHAYGDGKVSDEDFKKYSKLPQMVASIRLPRGLPK